MVNMASGHIVQNRRQIQKQFQKGLKILLDTFHDTILLHSQNIHVENFSNIPKGFLNVIIMYETMEGRSVKLEALGEIDENCIHTLDFIWQSMRRATQEAPSNHSGPFASLTLPTQNDLFRVLADLVI